MKWILTYWKNPRETMRSFSEKYANKKRAILTIYSIALGISSISSVVDAYTNPDLYLGSLGLPVPLLLLGLFVVIFGLGLLAWWIWSYIVTFIANKIFKLSTTSYAVRQSETLSVAAPLPLFIGLGLIMMGFLFFVPLVGMLMIPVFIVIGIWSTICKYKCLGEMMGCGAWKAFFVSALPIILIMILTTVALAFFNMGTYSNYLDKAYEAEQAALSNNIEIDTSNLNIDTDVKIVE